MELQDHHEQVKQHFWRNYLAHAVEGGLYMGGKAFVAPMTVLPVVVHDLGGPAWLIAAAPILLQIGFQLPPLLVAHRVEKLHWVKPLILVTGIFQRLPYLFAGLALLLLTQHRPHLALGIVVLCPLISGLSGGVSHSAWMELVAKTIPDRRRSSLWAARHTISSVIGLIAGPIIALVLRYHPGVTGYGILHLVLFSLLAVSYAIFATIRETHLPARPAKETPSLTSNLRALPQLVRSDPRLRVFLLSRLTMPGMLIVVPFMTIHVLRVTDRPRAFMGTLVTAQMLGAILGNILAGYLGDRKGGRTVMILGSLSSAGVCISAIYGGAWWQFLLVYLFWGVAGAFNRVGNATITLEICPLKKRATYLAIIAAASLTGTPLYWFLSDRLWTDTGGVFGYLAMVAASVMLITAMLQWRVAEPRHEPARDPDLQAVGNRRKE